VIPPGSPLIKKLMKLIYDEYIPAKIHPGIHTKGMKT
jgi:hypothetical protein